jgi:uncharacterized protein
VLPPVIVDTNVVVAGLITANAESPVARVLDGMLAAVFSFVLSASLLAEYRAVLRRPPLRKAHGLTVGELDAILVRLAQHAVVLAPGKAARAPDPGDQHLWDLLAEREDLVLVTGDKRLQRDRAMGSRVLAPGAFVERWLSGSP